MMMHVLVISLLFGFISTRPKPQELLPIKQHGLFGFINLEGKIVIKPRFLKVSKFSEGLAAVREGGLYGYINMKDEYVIPPIYDYAQDFSEGVAIVYDSNGDPSAIDHMGKVLFSKPYKQIGDFENGCAIVVTELNHHGLINKHGKLIIETTSYYGIKQLGEGLLELSKATMHHYSKFIIDTLGNVIFPVVEGMRIEKYKDGIAKFEFDDHSSDEGFIDKNGRILFKGNFHFQSSYNQIENPFREGKAVVSSKKYQKKEVHNGKIWVFPKEAIIDTTGKIIIDDSTISNITNFENNKAFAIKNDSICILDENGRVIRYFSICKDSGTAKLRIENTWAQPSFVHGNIIISFCRKEEYYNAILDTSGRIFFSPDSMRLRRTDNPGLFSWSIRKLGMEKNFIIDPKTGKIISFEDTSLQGVTYHENYIVGYTSDGQRYIGYDGRSLTKHDLYAANYDDSGNMMDGFEFNVDRKWSGSYSVADFNKNIKDKGTFVLGNIADLNLRADTSISLLYAGIDTFQNYSPSVFLRNVARKFIIANTTSSPLKMIPYPACILQAKNREGRWVDIEKQERLICGGTDMRYIDIPPGKYGLLAGSLYSGSFKTKLRLRLDTVYSNEFDGSVNPAQFWRE
jgi:hypothetical protein